MKKQILSVAIALLIGSTVCIAQDNNGNRGGQRGGNMTQRIEQMVTELGLNETQATQFKEVMENIRPGKDGKPGERPSREEMLTLSLSHSISVSFFLSLPLFLSVLLSISFSLFHSLFLPSLSLSHSLFLSFSL